MTLDEDLAFAPAVELRALIAEKKVSPVDVTELYLRRIDEMNPKLNAYLTVAHDEALRAAKAAEQAVVDGDQLGPLHGLPISIKDLEMTKGIRTTSGSVVYKDRVPQKDTIVVERLRKAGAVILGKTNTPEFGLLATTRNRLGDDCRNPWDTERTTGGSSGGAGAAVVAGLCSLATGSDGGGSIRIPSSFCGVFGLKPTQGRIPILPGSGTSRIPELFGQPGPMARTVPDAALLLQVLAGHDVRDLDCLRDAPPDFTAAANKAIEGVRIAWSSDYGYAAVDPEVVKVTSKAASVFEGLGCVVDESPLALDSPWDAYWPISSTRAYARYGHLLEDNAEQLSDYTVATLERGATVTGVQYARSLGHIGTLKAEFERVFRRYDLLLSPTMAVPALRIGQRLTEIAGREIDPFWGPYPFAFPINMIGHPAASVPCGHSSDGMPIGLHVVGREGDEETVIAACAAFEHAMPWTARKPAVS